jgi:hypothetical protein
MIIHFKCRRSLLDEVRDDLVRRHSFAHERVGFLFAGVAAFQQELLLLPFEYRPVADDDYVDDPRVGAMMGSDAIRKALQHGNRTRTAVIHVHMHLHSGRPEFSGVDVRENAKFMPNFFNVLPDRPHGAVVLSRDSMVGSVWLRRDAPPLSITRFSAVGAPMWTEDTAS